MTKFDSRQTRPGFGRATRLAVMLLALALVSSTVCAQEKAHGWPGLDLPRLPTVYVLDDTGHETEGRLLRLEPDSLVILVAGAERRFEAGSVRRIEKRGDSLQNGAIIGTVTGALFGLLTAGMADCPGQHPSGPCAGSHAVLFLIQTGTWAAIGTGIDALIPGRTRLYEAPAAQPSAGRVGSATAPSLGNFAVSLSFRW